jgi:signal transduction histidine kinase
MMDECEDMDVNAIIPAYLPQPFMRAIGIVLLLLPGHALIAQQIEVTRYDVGEGLPQSMVNHVLQDREGFMWLGTGDGLARFDGQRFVVYKHDPLDSNSLSHNSIWSLAERDEHHFWVGTRSGLDLLDLRTGCFEHIATGVLVQNGCWRPLRLANTQATFYSPMCTALLTLSAQGGQSTALRHSSTHVMHCDARTGTITQVLGRDTLLTRTVDGMETIFLLPHPEQETITDLIALGDRWLVLSTGGAWTWSKGEGRGELPPTTAAWLKRSPGAKVGRIDARGDLWLGLSGTGVLVLDSALKVVRMYPLLSESERPLNITTITFDHHGNTWVGSDGKGVFCIAPQMIKFGRCMPEQGMSWEPDSWFVRGFAQWDAYHVLVSFYQGGLALFDERSGQLSPLQLAPDAQRALNGKDFQHPINDRNGSVWGGDLFHVFAIERSTAKLVYAEHTPRGSTHTTGPDGDVVIMTMETIRSMRYANGKMVDEVYPSPRLHARFNSLGLTPDKFFLDHQWTILLGSATLPVQAWRNDVDVPIGPFPPTVRMTALVPDNASNYWLTTNDGLYHLDAASLSVKGHWTIHDGLPDQFLYGMLPGKNGNWWISSNLGLSDFDPATNNFTNYSTSDGLQSTEFNSHAYFRSASGRLYFGGVNGFNHFVPDIMGSDPDSAQVALIAITAQDSLIDLTTLGEAALIALPYGRNHLRMDLAVLEFSAPKENRYRYRITGYSEWTEHPAERPIVITNIPAGTYAVEVAGINGDGLASTARTMLTVHVPLPFSASPWAYVLAGVLGFGMLAGAAFLLYRQRLERRLEKTEQEMKELRIRARIAQDLHDDLGSGLARITALSRTATRHADRGDDVRQPVVKLTELTQELMHDLRDVVWVNDPHGGILSDLLLRIRDHVQDLFEGSPCKVDIHLPQPLPERNIGPLSKRNLYLIAKEAAHNAGKHSAATEVVLSFTLDATHFSMELYDNGAGPARVTSTGGHGLRNMHARAAELGLTLYSGGNADSGYSISLAGPPSTLDL